MKVFASYAKYYDLLYKDKDYKSEADYIEKFIKKYKPDSKKILDLGCGTGRHAAIFAKRGFNVTGVELSEHMIEIAQIHLKNNDTLSENLKFVQGDIKNIKLNEKFDIVMLLFHVMSYQTKNEDIKQTLKTVKEHIKPDGIFIFDFWYGPAVLAQKPESRLKKLESEDIVIERFAMPVMYINENSVDVNYKILIKEKSDGSVSEINETHKMRYFFLPEIELFFSDFELKLNYCEEWMTSNELSEKSWSALAIASLK
ncbi:MAG: class I SAM-dependent methyltransferase [Bacteroidota bacterium]|nr:class I SAM-dependent methyltransferase [Bacteroidota bacterium]